MCDDEDRVPGAAGNGGAHVPQIDPAAAGDVHGKAVDPRPSTRAPASFPATQAAAPAEAGATRRTVGMERRELLREPVRGGVVERRLERRGCLWERRRAGRS